ncbi:hypothetical protein BRADI_1g12065v3 [Brachypodium distachyon]|uniref:Uncharacterized protein n=1 Tax=Brachypodium distachyon TaxID=15368 RepID=A0A2K2DJ33_BRADI|nr:hypothetical protein BRADI_1g12065v3 [Brachypodium distachyon]
MMIDEKLLHLSTGITRRIWKRTSISKRYLLCHLQCMIMPGVLYENGQMGITMHPKFFSQQGCDLQEQFFSRNI